MSKGKAGCIDCNAEKHKIVEYPKWKLYLCRSCHKSYCVKHSLAHEHETVRLR